jgi:hypothetical protein
MNDYDRAEWDAEEASYYDDGKKTSAVSSWDPGDNFGIGKIRSSEIWCALPVVAAAFVMY